MKKLMLVIPMLAVPMLVAQQSGSPSEDEYDGTILPLVGLPGVKVVIEDLNDHAKAGGLSVAELRKDVVERLKHAGIRILTDEEHLDTPGHPILGVTVTAATFQTKLRNTTLGYACVIEVKLDEIVYLERQLGNENLPRWFGTVWDTSQLWMADRGGLRSVVRQGIREKIDEFCRDVRFAKMLEASLSKPVKDGDPD